MLLPFFLLFGQNAYPWLSHVSPKIVNRVSDSRRSRGESRATKRGEVCTKTTELVTVVYSSEVIHVAKFETKGKDLYIDGNKVLRGWESWNGWYWFATEKVREQLSDLGDGKGTPDTIEA